MAVQSRNSVLPQPIASEDAACMVILRQVFPPATGWAFTQTLSPWILSRRSARQLEYEAICWKFEFATMEVVRAGV